MSQYKSSDLTVAELKALCKKNGIKGYSKLRKDELIIKCYQPQVEKKLSKKAPPKKSRKTSIKKAVKKIEGPIAVVMKPESCALEELGEDYTVHDELGAGSFGVVYNVCKSDDCNYVLKIEKQLEITRRFHEGENKDGRYGKIAGELGIGPKVYDYGVCTDSEGNEHNWTLMEKIQGKTLSKIYPLKPKYITEALGKYLKLIKDGNIVQRDLVGDNIIVTPAGKVYIIDYGTAKKLDEWDHELSEQMAGTADQMADTAAFLISSITTDLDTDSLDKSSKVNLWREDDLKSREKIYRDLIDAGDKWLSKTFGERIQMSLLYPPDIFEDRNGNLSSEMEKWLRKHPHVTLDDW